MSGLIARFLERFSQYSAVKAEYFAPEWKQEYREREGTT
jgi:hypothetical protein